MPYYRCAACDLTVYSGSGYSNSRVCPECDAPLDRASRVHFIAAPSRELQRQMVREPEAPAAARRELDLMAGELVPAERDIVALLTTELITNSVQHAGAEAGDLFALAVSITDRCVRVSVGDGGEGFRPDGRVNLQPTDGHWGLQLVEELSDRWGITTDAGTSVWFELDRALSRRANGARAAAGSVS
jgi:anti-sigma regulatory factor (Ser/Thr protein kinase)